jgi:hypothetical protein
MFLWKYIDISNEEIENIKKLYLNNLPNNNHFFQPIDIDISNFLGLEVQRFVLIQVEANAVGRIHTDWRPNNYGNQLALNIPLINCENSTTSLWSSDYDPPTQYTANGQPYNFFNPDRCIKLSEFRLTAPVIFRTDVPHSVDNPTSEIRKAISIRFKTDPWHLVNTP